MTLPEYLSGRQIPRTLSQRIESEFSSLKTNNELLITGFSSAGEPLIAKVDDSGVSMVEDFQAIGSGSYLATSILWEREYSSSCSESAAYYLVYEAKRFSERAEGINKTTTMVALVPRQSVSLLFFNDKGIAALADMYKRFGLQEYVESSLTDQCFWHYSTVEPTQPSTTHDPKPPLPSRE